MHTPARTATELSRSLQATMRKQIPYATALAVNATAESVQRAQRAGQRERFTIRREQWADRSVKIRRGEFATKRNPVAIIRIEAPGADPGRSQILTQHEDGGEKKPRGQSLAVPKEARANVRVIIRKNQRPRAFEFGPGRRGPRATVYQGERRTFMIRLHNRSGWILRRVAKQRIRKLFDGTKLLYTLTPKAKLKPRLAFIRTAERTARKEIGPNMDRALAKAMATAR